MDSPSCLSTRSKYLAAVTRHKLTSGDFVGPDVAGRDVGGVLAPHGKLLLSFSVKRHINRRTVKDIGARQVYDTNAAPIIARGGKFTLSALLNIY